MTRNCLKRESLVFAQEYVYPKLVHLYIQIGRLSQISSDANKINVPKL